MSYTQNPNDYKYSFSGADCRATAFYPGQHHLKAWIDGKIAALLAYAEELRYDSEIQRIASLMQEIESIEKITTKHKQDIDMMGGAFASEKDVRDLRDFAMDGVKDGTTQQNRKVRRRGSTLSEDVIGGANAAWGAGHPNTLQLYEFKADRKTPAISDEQWTALETSQEKLLVQAKEKLEKHGPAMKRAEKLTKALVDSKANQRAKARLDELRELERAIADLMVLQGKFCSYDFAELDSMATISISVHEPKGIVRRLGFRNICGITRSVRTIAGTMIFTVVDNHPLAKLMALDPQQVWEGVEGDKVTRFKWMVDMALGVGDKDKHRLGRNFIRVATDLAPFHLILNYVAEYFPYNIRAASRMLDAGQDEINKIRKEQADLIREYQKVTGENPGNWFNSVDDPGLNPKKQKLHGGGRQKYSDLYRYKTKMQRKYLELGRDITTMKSMGTKIRDAEKPMGASLILENVEFLDQGMVTSTNDMVTEISYNFIASDYYELSAFHGGQGSPFPEISKIMEKFAWRMNMTDEVLEEQFDIDLKTPAGEELGKNWDGEKLQLGMDPRVTVTANPLDDPGVNLSELGYEHKKDSWYDMDNEQPEDWMVQGAGAPGKRWNWKDQNK